MRVRKKRKKKRERETAGSLANFETESVSRHCKCHNVVTRRRRRRSERTCDNWHRSLILSRARARTTLIEYYHRRGRMRQARETTGRLHGLRQVADYDDNDNEPGAGGVLSRARRTR